MTARGAPEARLFTREFATLSAAVLVFFVAGGILLPITPLYTQEVLLGDRIRGGDRHRRLRRCFARHAAVRPADRSTRPSRGAAPRRHGLHRRHSSDEPGRGQPAAPATPATSQDAGPGSESRDRARRDRRDRLSPPRAAHLGLPSPDRAGLGGLYLGRSCSAGVAFRCRRSARGHGRHPAVTGRARGPPACRRLGSRRGPRVVATLTATPRRSPLAPTAASAPRACSSAAGRHARARAAAGAPAPYTATLRPWTSTASSSPAPA